MAMHEEPRGLVAMRASISLKQRIALMFVPLIAANIAVWIWALAAFHDHPVLLGTCALAYVLGLRHAVDPDHIAAIDNVTRKLMQEKRQPISVGLWFALGHSALICLAVAAIAFTATSLTDERFENWREIGGVISTICSALILYTIAVFNMVVLVNVWKTWRALQRTGRYEEDQLDKILQGRGFLARLMQPLFRLISKSWHMAPLGFLFGLGFDTATEISLFSIAATESARGFSSASIMIFPLLFTAGMALIDTLDGVLMLGAYQWATVQPRRKLIYNLVITALSVAVALFIGLLETLALFCAKLDLTEGFWGVVAALNAWYGDLGFVIVGLFAAVWLGAWLFYRSKRMALS